MLNKLFRYTQKLKKRMFFEKWPHPPYVPLDHEPLFLFILTPPYSGSTALAKLLNSSHNSMMLHSKGEGQWLIPGLCEPDRWEPKKYIDWSSVQKVWNNRIKLVEGLVGRVDVVIEKSPPNLVRTNSLLEVYSKHELIVFNRNPYANCSSILFRVHSPNNRSENERIEILRMLALDWVFRSRLVKQCIDRYDPISFTYEKLCSDSEAIISRIIERVPALSDIDSESIIKVKDYPPQKIINQNDRQVNNLSDREKEAIASSLIEHEELLNFFNYTSDWKKDIEIGGANSTSNL